jgi:uncharacterized protein YegJ (DUF2314 family)
MRAATVASIAVFALGILACGADDAAKTGATRRAAAVPGTPVAKGSLLPDHLTAEYEVILPPGTDAAPAIASATVAAAKVPSATATAVPLTDQPFRPELLKYFGVDLTDSDRLALLAARDTVRVAVPSGIGTRADAEHAAAAIAAILASSVHGWVLDPWTLQTFGADTFAARRPPDGPEEVVALVAVHMVREDVGDGIFLDTQGMGRFGLPDLVIHDVPPSFSEQIHDLLDAAAQTLIEQGGLTDDGQLRVRVAALKTPPWPEEAKAIEASSGTGDITLGARWVTEPDAPPGDNIELVLPGEGAAAARAYAALSFLAPPEHAPLARANDDAELSAARDRALTAFKALAPHFQNGIPDLEQLSVKAPFRTTAGDFDVEWMWVQVSSWQGNTLHGVLLNAPYGVMPVHAGDSVDVNVDDIFDYLWRRADGTEVGNETTGILLRRESEAK